MTMERRSVRRREAARSAWIMRCMSWVLPWPVPPTMWACSKRIDGQESGMERAARRLTRTVYHQGTFLPVHACRLSLLYDRVRADQAMAEFVRIGIGLEAPDAISLRLVT